MKMKVTGLRELDAALMTMKQSTARGVVRRALLTAAQPIADDMAKRAPSPGKYGTGYLGEHIDTGIRLSRRQRSVSRKESDVEVYAGATRVDQAVFQEFGTINHAAQPFARPAWDAGKMDALDTVKTELAAEIEKTAARAAKRATRKG
jgi:HK97 gp10 family phage protein